MNRLTSSYTNDRDGELPGDGSAISSSLATDSKGNEAHLDQFCECTLRKDPKKDRWQNGQWRKQCHRCRAEKQVFGIQNQIVPKNLIQTPSADLQSKLPKHSKSLSAQNAISIATIPIGISSSLHSVAGTSIFSDSQEQQKLLESLEYKPSAEAIVREILRYQKEGRDLPWLQDIIPELRPGVESGAEWVQSARNKLWGADVWEQHKKLCEKRELLGQTLPELPTNDYGLRRYWLTIIETLKPISLRMALVVDRVSIVIGRRDCILLTPGGTWRETPTETNTPQYTFLVIRQVLQDKILSPLIDAITMKIHQGDSYETYDNAESVDSNQAQSHQRTLDLREALQNLRSVVIEEKDIDDSSTAERFEHSELTALAKKESGEAYGTAEKRPGSPTRALAEIKKLRMDT
ncbi:hypothetical protein AG0111_0g4863 [Alternaria gaisen]|uniref:Uncharacterized protein n=1 Tax=Alternaria gaisen TaxID=167740 RepID=A0ACB6FQI3_9PLEO|nr:hypothetical protein AG0111_0g4863 [Alternaria gaisen]